MSFLCWSQSLMHLSSVFIDLFIHVNSRGLALLCSIVYNLFELLDVLFFHAVGFADFIMPRCACASEVYGIGWYMYQKLLDTSPSTRARALANSSALPHAGDRLNGVPSDVLGLHMQDKEFNSCLKYWLGIPLHSAPHLCPACRTSADEYGDHQVGCGGNGDRITRHNAVRDVIFSAAQSAALGPSREAQGLIPESLSRPADVFLPTWQGGRPAALEVHVISPLQQTLIHEAAFSPGHALEVGVRRKLTTHLQACRSIGVNFIPIVAETLGGLGEEAINIIGAIGNAIDRRVTMTHSSSSTKTEAYVSSPGHCTLERKCLPVASSPINFTSFSGWYPLNCMPPPLIFWSVAFVHLYCLIYSSVFVASFAGLPFSVIILFLLFVTILTPYGNNWREQRKKKGSH